MRTLITLVLALLAGCDFATTEIPVDGSIVILEASGWSQAELDSISKGAHYWDQLGLRIIPSWEATPEDFANAKASYTIKRDSFSWPGVSNPPSGVTWPGLGYSTIYPNVLGDTAAWALPVVTAHELGHAMGLHHSSDQHAVMFHAPGPVNMHQLTEGDLQAFLAAHPQ